MWVQFHLESRLQSQLAWGYTANFSKAHSSYKHPPPKRDAKLHGTRAHRKYPPCAASAAQFVSNSSQRRTDTSILDSIVESCGKRHTTEEELQLLMRDASLETLMGAAKQLRNQAHSVITFSPKVFLPLTRLCRDSCGYCTFAQPPVPGRRAYMTLEEVVSVALMGAEQGCTEALFTLGDKPELLYQEAADELRAMGYATTLDYVAAAAGAVLRETGLLPHVNAGVMGQADLAALRQVSASQGLMLESASERLLQPGGPHHGCPDKEPSVRLATIEAAGRAGVPFTTGILIGIGETRSERVHALCLIRDLHAQYGHIQEVIIQNFRAKKGTAMAGAAEPPLGELLWTVAMARIILGPHMSIQAPPNLTPGDTSNGSAAFVEDSWRALLDAGINDWGGISPVTRDYVNPEKPWPHVEALAATTAAAGFPLLPRLPVYPAYIGSAPGRWLDGSGGAGSVFAAVLRTADGAGLARGSNWAPGSSRKERYSAPLPAAARFAQAVDQLKVSGSQQGSTAGLHAAIKAGAAGGSAEEGIADSRVSEGQMRIDGKSSSSLGGLAGGTDSAHESAEAGCGEVGEQMSGGEAESSSSARRDGLSGGSAAQAGLPGQPGGEAGSAAGGGMRRSTPLPARPQGGRAWQVSLNEWGLLEGCPGPAASPEVGRLLGWVLTGRRQLAEADMVRLFSTRGADMQAVCSAADQLRQRVNGDVVTYVVNRNINYTNVCTFKCTFCAFSKGRATEDLRGPAYLLPLEEVTRRTAEAWARGATEVCMQGGIHPEFTGETYLQILRAAKAGAPDIHVHAFSPLEVHQGAATLGLPVRDYLIRLKDAGLASLPGTAAEVLDDGVRAVLCPDKLTTAQWLEVVEAAHSVGLKTTSTIMFGHVDGPISWARHLAALRGVAARTGGITEFVPLPFVHMEAPNFIKGLARRGPTLRECILMHAVARLALHPHIPNIQASWPKMGPERAAALLSAGCNDMGGSIMNESITRAAGASFGQELVPERMEEYIRGVGRVPRQRTTLYGQAPEGQRAKSFGAAPLLPT